jgi:hypothetical protein
MKRKKLKIAWAQVLLRPDLENLEPEIGHLVR